MEIPKATEYVEQAVADLQSSGMALMTGLLSDGEVTSIRHRLQDMAEFDRRTGTAILEDGSASDGRYEPGVNQRLVNVLGRDLGFGSLVRNAEILRVCRALFSSSYGYSPAVIEAYQFDGVLLSSLSANIANPGGKPMNLHADQGFVPSTTPYPLLLNVMWMISAFTPGNGATRVAPGSHRADADTLYASTPATCPVVAPAGTALLFDGRVWHGTGANMTTEARYGLLATYCRPWVRPFENFAVTLSAEQIKAAPECLKQLTGFDRWFVYDDPRAQVTVASSSD